LDLQILIFYGTIILIFFSPAIFGGDGIISRFRYKRELSALERSLIRELRKIDFEINTVLWTQLLPLSIFYDRRLWYAQFPNLKEIDGAYKTGSRGYQKLVDGRRRKICRHLRERVMGFDS